MQFLICSLPPVVVSCVSAYTHFTWTFDPPCGRVTGISRTILHFRLLQRTTPTIYRTRWLRTHILRPCLYIIWVTYTQSKKLTTISAIHTFPARSDKINVKSNYEFNFIVIVLFNSYGCALMPTGIIYVYIIV